MATSAVLTPVSGGGAVTYASGCDFAVAGKYYDELKEKTAEYRIEIGGTPGVDGNWTKTYGYRGQRIELSVWYVAASSDAVSAAIDSDNLALSGGPSTLVANGVTYHACIVEQFEQQTQTKITGLPSGLFCAQVQIVVNSRR